MNISNGFKNFLLFFDDNYVLILISIALIIGIYTKIENFLLRSRDEKISIAKNQIKQVMLKMVSDVEKEYINIEHSGKIKRAEVIERIFKEYPILSKVSNQNALISYIDYQIEDALAELENIVNRKL